MSGDATSGASGSPGPIPAGWYDDPSGGGGKRWWDGTGWTSHVQEPLTVPTMPAVPVMPGVPQAPVEPVLRAHRIGVGTEDTRAAWWIAFSPLWSVVAQAIVVATVMAILSNQLVQFVPWLVIANVALWALVLGLAFADRAKLRSSGNASAASPFWVLLTPLAYLIVRAQHVRMYATGGWAFVIWWCVALVLAPGIAVLGVFAAYGIFAY